MALFRKGLKDPVRATAQVVAASNPPGNAAYAPIHLNLVVHADGAAPVPVEVRQRAARCKKFPVPGQQIPVEVERGDPTSVRVLWDELPTREELARDHAARVAGAQAGAHATHAPDPAGGAPDLSQLPAGVADIVRQVQQAAPGARIEVTGADGPVSAAPTPGATAPTGGADAGAGGLDRVEALERLADLHERGLLSAAEFEREKARILGSS